MWMRHAAEKHMKNTVIAYLNKTYHPRAVFLYGSYQRGDQDAYSDFDCTLIVDEKPRKHDDTVICGVPLDCFLFIADEAETGDPDIFLPVCDAEIVQDDGVGRRLQMRVRDYVHAHERIDDEEKAFIRAWIRKTVKRAEKGDDEGNFRAVAFLWESLTDYCFLRDRFYFGSKQTIADLKRFDADGYELFHTAITEKTLAAIAAWAAHVVKE